ncbi:MAG: hypothetical protein CVV18_08890, partial [Gammaproteobacteria bacterium HGW-Gammaproteobacteria-8]
MASGSGLAPIMALTEAALRAGQETIGVEIYPFRLTDENLAAHAESQWIDFWNSLRPAHDHFLEQGIPARVVAGALGYRTADEHEPAAAAGDAISAP